jgi:hypothetical protein
VERRRLGGDRVVLLVRAEQQPQRRRVAGGRQLAAQLLLALLRRGDRVGGGRRRLAGGGGRLGQRGHAARRADPVEQRDLVVEGGQPGRGLGRRPPRLLQRGHARGDQRREREHRVDPLGRAGQGLVGGVVEPGQQLVDRPQVGVGLLRPGGGPLLDVLVDVQTQQVDQDLLAGRRLGVQEVGELTLRQDHAAGELLVRQADGLDDREVHLGRGAGQHVTQVVQAHPGVEPGHVEAGRHQLQARPGGLDVPAPVAADHPGRHIP